jgi:hypothetical protein
MAIQQQQLSNPNSSIKTMDSRHFALAIFLDKKKTL